MVFLKLTKCLQKNVLSLPIRNSSWYQNNISASVLFINRIYTRLLNILKFFYVNTTRHNNYFFRRTTINLFNVVFHEVIGNNDLLSIGHDFIVVFFYRIIKTTVISVKCRNEFATG